MKDAEGPSSPIVELVAAMLTLEHAIARWLEHARTTVAGVPGAAVAADRWLAIAERHIATLRTRPGAAAANRGSLPPDARDAREVNGAAGAIRGVYVAVNDAAAGYTVLHAVAHRFFDSEGEANTADLAEAHLRDYAGVAQEANQLLSEAAIHDLTASGSACRCQCPACALGICLCAPHGTNTVNAAWREGGPQPSAPAGVAVRPPRPRSAAAEAGLVAGDRVVAVDGVAIASETNLPVMQAAIRARASGEALTLTVHRRESGTEAVTVTRP